MTKKILMLLVALTAGKMTARAQLMKYPDYTADLALIKAQPLVVLLDEADPKEVRKLAGKPAELAQYKAAIALYNTQVQEYAPKLWHYSAGVVFKPETEYETLRKAKGAKTPVFHHIQGRESQTTPGPMGNRLETVSFGAEQVAHLQLDLVGNGANNLFWNGIAPLGALHLTDVISGFRALQDAIEAKIATADMKAYKPATATLMLRNIKDRQQLRTKTLLLDRSDLEEGLTETDIKKLYPFAFQLVSLQDIETAVVAADARYTYARRMTIGPGETGPVIIDVATGKPLTQSISKKGIGKADFKRFTQSASSPERDAKMTAKLEKFVHD